MHELNNKRVINGWAMYDWANSAYSLTITSAIFPVYYSTVSKNANLQLFGHKLETAAAFSYTISFAFLIVSILTPVLSGIADFSGIKKKMMAFFVLLGSVSCSLMWWFDSHNIQLGLLLFGLAAIGYAGSIVFYNAFLPEISTEDQYDKVSAKGFAYGYIGSVILLIVNLILIQFPSIFFDIDGYANQLISSQKIDQVAAHELSISHFQGVASRLAFVSVGIWWFMFSRITFKRLPKETPASKVDRGILTGGYHQLKQVFNEVKENRTIKMYLISFFFTAMGLQTVMYVAAIFGEYELHLETGKLIGTILIIQLVAIIGAKGFAFASSKFGNIKTLIFCIFIWALICIGAYLIQNEIHFYILATIVGLVMGGSQSLFRSTFAKIIPDDTKNHASYFSFYDVCEKLAIVCGTFSFGLLNDLTGNMRTATLMLALYFIIGIVFISRIRNFTIHLG